MVARNAEVVGVAHRHPARPDLVGLVHRDLHGLGRDDQAESPVAVHGGGAGCFVDDADLRRGIQAVVVVQPDVARQPGDAVGVDAAQVGADEDFGGQKGFFRRAADFFENRLYEFL